MKSLERLLASPLNQPPVKQLNQRSFFADHVLERPSEELHASTREEEYYHLLTPVIL
jgi:hypothetical protein